MTFPTDGYMANTLTVAVSALQDGIDEAERIQFQFASPISGGVLENSTALDIAIQAFVDALAEVYQSPDYSIRVQKGYTSGKSESAAALPS